MRQSRANVDLTDSNKDTYINKDFIYIHGRKMERSIKALSLKQYMNSSEGEEFYMNKFKSLLQLRCVLFTGIKMDILTAK